MIPSNDPRAELQEEVTRCLRPVCPDIPDDELRSLVARIVEAELAHRRPAAPGEGDRHPAAADRG